MVECGDSLVETVVAWSRQDNEQGPCGSWLAPHEPWEERHDSWQTMQLDW